MNALESPLEALAFDYLSFGLLTVVNNVWTWVAVITAAVSVWKLKASASPRGDFPDEASPVNRRDDEPAAEAAAAADASTSTSVLQDAKPLNAAAPSSPCVFNREGRTSGKFIFYYDPMEEEEGDRDEDGNGEGNGEDGNVGAEKEWCGRGWEVMMRMRMWDDIHTGFYRYQDLTVLDGSVVRLWDDRRRRNGSTITTIMW